MQIIGAGMAGLLAGQYFRSHDPIIIEKQPLLPNNHTALLRFRSEAVSDLTGIRFKEVNVQKLINYKEAHHESGNIFLNNLYSQKVTGGVYSRSLMNIKDSTRYIAPDTFVSRVATGLSIWYSMDAEKHIHHQMRDSNEPMISTMPLATLAEILGWELKQDLQTREIWTFTFDLEMDIDVYQTCYYPNPSLPLYRLSITGDRVIAEFCMNPNCHSEWDGRTITNIMHFLEIDFGIHASDCLFDNPELKHQKHGKIAPGDRDEIHEFIGWASREYNIYSLGRWGTHRQILMDDVVDDLKVIDNLIESKGYRR